MSTHILHKNPNAFYYFTITCYNWLYLFEKTNLYSFLYEWFDVLKQDNVFISAYVIMPNHLHAIVYCKGTEKYINKILGEGKRFISYEVINRLKKENESEILGILTRGVTQTDKERGKLHSVFESSMDIKEIETEKFMIQKINYIHRNPVSGKWKLVDDYRLYAYSSAAFYEPVEGNIYKGYPIMHYNNMEFEN